MLFGKHAVRCRAPVLNRLRIDTTVLFEKDGKHAQGVSSRDPVSRWLLRILRTYSWRVLRAHQWSSRPSRQNRPEPGYPSVQRVVRKIQLRAEPLQLASSDGYVERRSITMRMDRS